MGFTEFIRSNKDHKVELLSLYVSTFLLRTGFGGAIILFDWTLVWAIENSLGIDKTASPTAILLISFSAITYYVAEIFLTGYYGTRSDIVGAKPVILYATIGAGVVLLLYSPTSIIFNSMIKYNAIVALLIMTAYLSVIHLIHGIFASAKVAPSLGFINFNSLNENRALHMAWYDNAILYGRAAGILLGGLLWILLDVDNASNSLDQEANKIASTFPFLSILLIFAVIIIVIGLNNTDPIDNPKKFSIKEDVSIAARVMLNDDRRHLLLPWVSIAALIGSASLWGPTVSFIVSGNGNSSHRGFDALLPIMVVLVSLALPAPIWGIIADKKGRKFTLLVGLFGMPISGILGLSFGYPFYRDDISISNLPFLLSLVPAALFFSALIPVLMGALGDTAEKTQDGEVMSGYHFIIASGEIIGVLVGGLVIGIFSVFQSITGLFGTGQSGNSLAILVGFVIFELTLVVGMVYGILKIPEDSEFSQKNHSRT